MEGNQDLTLHTCGERPMIIRSGRDRFHTQNFTLLSIEFFVNGFSGCSCKSCGSFATSKHRGVPVRHFMSNLDWERTLASPILWHLVTG